MSNSLNMDSLLGISLAEWMQSVL